MNLYSIKYYNNVGNMYLLSSIFIHASLNLWSFSSGVLFDEVVDKAVSMPYL